MRFLVSHAGVGRCALRFDRRRHPDVDARQHGGGPRISNRVRWLLLLLVSAAFMVVAIRAASPPAPRLAASQTPKRATTSIGQVAPSAVEWLFNRVIAELQALPEFYFTNTRSEVAGRWSRQAAMIRQSAKDMQDAGLTQGPSHAQSIADTVAAISQCITSGDSTDNSRVARSVNEVCSGGRSVAQDGIRTIIQDRVDALARS